MHPRPPSVPAEGQQVDDLGWDDDSEEASVLIVDIAKEDGGSVIGGSQSQDQSSDNAWGTMRTLKHPYSPRAGLLSLFKNNSSLRPNIDALAANVDGFGWQLEPVLDFDDEGIREQVSTAIYLNKHSDWEEMDPTTRGKRPALPSEKEINDTIAEWRQDASLERARIKQHFQGACYESSFVDLRKHTTTDKEVLGDGAWEVIRARGHEGAPRRYIRIDSNTLRYTERYEEVQAHEWYWTSPVTYQKVPVMRRFHLIVQNDGSGLDMRYFREFGDPRIISNISGKAYETVEKLKSAEGEEGARPANEILMWSIYFPGTRYGVPRWHGAIADVRGSNIAANENVEDLSNSSIPRGILAVSEGKVGEKGAQNLRSLFKASKGRARTRMAIINARTPRSRQFMPGSSGVKVEWIDLTGAQREDGMFLEYDKRADLKVGRQFRQPPIVRGDTRDYNKATGTAALQYTDEQVHQPDRNTFDWTVNRRLLPELGIRFWRFRTKGPVRVDPDAESKLIETILKQGVVVPAELRTWVERRLGIDLVRLAGEWQQLPLALIAQGWRPEAKPALSEGDPNDGTAGDKPDELDASPPDDETNPPLGVLKANVDRLTALEHALSSDEGRAILGEFRASIAKDRERFAAIDRMFERGQ